MPELHLDISQDDVRTAMQHAITEALTPEKCTELVREAVSRLLAGSWQNPSELQRIFHMAAEQVAREAAEVELKKPENVERIRALVIEAWEKLFQEGKREKLLDRVSNAIANGIAGRDY